MAGRNSRHLRVAEIAALGTVANRELSRRSPFVMVLLDDEVEHEAKRGRNAYARAFYPENVEKIAVVVPTFSPMDDVPIGR